MDNPAFITYLKQQGKSKTSIASYQRTISRFITWAETKHLEIETITYSELLDYIAHLRKGNLAQRTIKGYLIGITHYYNHLQKAELITDNPARYIKLHTNQTKKIYPPLSKEQIENLYKNYDINALKNTRPTARQSAIRNKIATGLMVYQGLDVNALSHLKTENIHVLNGTIEITNSRTHRGRTLALQAVQIIELDRYINQTRKELQTAFKREESEQLLITGYDRYRDAHKRLIQRLQKQAPQIQNTQHIRNSVIVHWLKQYNLREVQYMAGHKKIMSTESYLQNDTEGLQNDIDRFHPMNETH